MQPDDLSKTDTLPPVSSDTISNYPENREIAQTVYTFSMFPTTIYAFNAVDGKLKWSTRAEEGGSSGSVLATSNVVTYIGEANVLMALDTNGVQQWKLNLGKRSANSPIIADKGLLFVENDEFIYAINALDGVVKWKFSKTWIQNCTNNRLSVLDGTLYSYECGLVHAIDISTGTHKWDSEEARNFGNAIFFKTRIFAADDDDLRVFDTETGKLINTYFEVLEDNDINIKYGRIYQSTGNVLDSANPNIRLPRVGRTFKYEYPIMRAPLLGDNLVLGTLSISDALTGALYCEPDFQPDTRDRRGWISGATYLNGILYYPSGDRIAYSGGGGAIHYSELYAFDVKSKTLKWRTVVNDATFINQTPSVVTKEGISFRGIETFR